jgi:hypothetical protein
MPRARSRKTNPPSSYLCELVEGNQGELGEHFAVLLRESKGSWEHAPLFCLASSQAYHDNHLVGLRKLARDLKAPNTARIKLVEKYKGQVFHPKAASIEKKENQFLDQVITYLTQLIETRA